MKKLFLFIFTLLFISTAIVFSSFTKTNQKTNTDDLPQLAIEGKKFGLRDAKTGKLITEIKYDYIGSRSFYQTGLSSNTKSWFKNDYELVKLGNKWGIVDKNGKETIPPIYEDMGSESEGFVAAKLDGKWGVLSLEGKQITPFKYYEIREFKEGRAAVGKVQDSIQKEVTFDNLTPEEIAMGFKPDSSKRKENYPALWGFIDKNGKEITPLKYRGVREFSEGMAAVAIMDSVPIIIISSALTEEEIAMGFNYEDVTEYKKEYKMRWGFIDTNGNEIIPLEYDVISDEGFSEGLAVVINTKSVIEKIKLDKTTLDKVEMGKAVGTIEVDGKQQKIYKDKMYTTQTITEIDYLEEKNLMFVINKSNKVVFEIPYNIYPAHRNGYVEKFENGFLHVWYKEKYLRQYLNDEKEEIVVRRSAIFNKEGKDITSHKYQFAQIKDKGFIEVENWYDAKGNYADWDNRDSVVAGLLDKELNEVVPIGKYEGISYASKNFIYVRDKNYKFYLLNTKGKQIENPEPFYNRMKTYSKDEYINTENDSKHGITNSDFKVVFPPIYEDEIYFDENGLAELKLNNKYALANRKGKIISDFVYDKLDWTYQNCFKAKIEEQEFYINNQNECIGNCPDNSFLKKYDIKQAKIKN